MEPPWADFGFAVDVSEFYEQKRAALAVYESIFDSKGDRLLALYEAEDQYFGRLVGVCYAGVFRAHALLVVEDLAVFVPAIHG